VEERNGATDWTTKNHFRVRRSGTEPAGFPLSVDFEFAGNLNPNSVRVIPRGSTESLPLKVEWKIPQARVSFLSTAAPEYVIYFDRGNAGEVVAAPEPAMIGTGDRVTFGVPGVRGKLSVGLWAHPAAFDVDGDGRIDMVVGCADRPYNGTYFFRNIGSNEKPLFARGEWTGKGAKELVAADFNGDGALDLVVSGGYYSDFRRNRMSQFVKVPLKRDYHVGRDDLWQPVDWDGDGRIDLLTGVSDWRDYGWDDAFDSQGRWTRGPLHGYVYFHRNTGTNAEPKYADPVPLEAGGRRLDVYGSPAPQVANWFGRGLPDLVLGNFIDSLTVFRNTGSRTEPKLAAGEPVQAGGSVLKMDLCMIQPRTVDWFGDGRPSLLIAEEDGRVSLALNTAAKGAGEPKLAKPVYLEQVDPFVKSGALSRPVAFDWNGDGKLDIIAGNSAGYIQYFENIGTKTAPAFADRGYLSAGGKTIRRMAGPNGSVQGPAEEKWGYTNPSVADWDLDGLPDLLVNDIWGSVMWYRNTGSRTKPQLAPAQPLEVEWPGAAPKPDWVWWQPEGKQLLTQWRTTPKVVDWDRDGLPDLVMLDYRGYLSLFRRRRAADGKLLLGAPERIFVTASGRFLNLSKGRAGSSGRRKVDFQDLDGDGDLDLITDSDDGPVWWENVGSQEKPAMRPGRLLAKARLPGHNPTPNLADWNGDGVPDLLVGAEDGFFYYFDGRLLSVK
jgi:hypothetical protein